MRRRKLPELLEVIYANPLDFHRDFDGWLALNLHVFERITDMALKIKRRGFTHYGIATLWEAARYHTDLAEIGGQFKLNNNWRADVSGLIMLSYPQEFDEFFSQRERTSEELGCYRPEAPGTQMSIL